jgi:hypothetical protein
MLVEFASRFNRVNRKCSCHIPMFNVCSTHAVAPRHGLPSPTCVRPRCTARECPGPGSGGDSGARGGEGVYENSRQPHAPYRAGSVAGWPQAPRRSEPRAALPGQVQARPSAVPAAGAARQARLPHARRQGRRTEGAGQRGVAARAADTGSRGRGATVSRGARVHPQGGARLGGVGARTQAAAVADPVCSGAGEGLADRRGGAAANAQLSRASTHFRLSHKHRRHARAWPVHPRLCWASQRRGWPAFAGHDVDRECNGRAARPFSNAAARTPSSRGRGSRSDRTCPARPRPGTPRRAGPWWRWCAGAGRRDRGGRRARPGP